MRSQKGFQVSLRRLTTGLAESWPLASKTFGGCRFSATRLRQPLLCPEQISRTQVSRCLTPSQLNTVSWDAILSLLLLFTWLPHGHPRDLIRYYQKLGVRNKLHPFTTRQEINSCRSQVVGLFSCYVRSYFLLDRRHGH